MSRSRRSSTRAAAPVATVLIQSGTLRVGDAIVAGTAYGRVRAMLDENGEPVEEAYPSRPVQVQGLSTVPARRRHLHRHRGGPHRPPDRREARGRRAQRPAGEGAQAHQPRGLHQALEEGKVEALNLIIKGDVSGAVEALEEALLKIEVGDSVQLRILHRGVGADHRDATSTWRRSTTRSSSASTSARTCKARERAAREGVDVRFYSVIYAALEDIENSLKGMLKPEFEEVQSGVGRDPRGLPFLQGRQHRRCHRALRNDHAQRQGARHPRRRRGRRQPRHRVAAPVQGRRHRGA